MQRREFITILGGGAAAWPLAARAQQPAMPVVGYLYPAMPDPNLEAGFRKGLSEQGFVEGRNVAIDYRFARNDNDRIPELLAELVARKVAVIAAVGGTGAPQAAQAATRTIPIVFQYPRDPVVDGLVASLNRPGGNITGITSMNAELESKRIGLLCEVAPSAMRIGYLRGGADDQTRIRSVQSAAAALGRQFEFLLARTSRDIDDVFANLAQKRIDAVLVNAGPRLWSFRAHLATAAARAGVPVMYMERGYAEAGGLMSYGPDVPDMWRLVGAQVGRILKGDKPADLPVMRPTKFEFIINLQTARLLRIEIPPTMLALAEEVIE